MGYFKCTILFNMCTISFLSDNYYDINWLYPVYITYVYVYGFADFCTRKFQIGVMKLIFWILVPLGGVVRVWAWFVIIV